MKRFLSAVLALAMVLSLGAASGEAAETADSVIIGKIYTADDALGTVEAVAVKDGVIFYAGDEAGARALAGDSTEITEVPDDQLVMPGFIDGHTHVTNMQLTNMMVLFTTDDTLQDYIDKFTAYMAEKPDMPIYMGKGWINSSFENGCPTADILDALCPDKPVAMLSSDNHSLWCNTAFMEMMGVTADMEDPEGGKVERNADGTPNGCFRETAMAVVAGPVLALLSLSPEINTANVLAAQEAYAAMGYTSYLEIMVNNQEEPWITTAIDVYEELDQAGELTLYTQGGFVINNTDDAMELLDKAIEYKNSTAGGMFELTTVKIFMDGVIEGSTAYLSEPYANRDDGYCGESRWPDQEALDKLVQIIVKANEAGLTVHFHSMGDQATHDALDCIERAYEQIGQPVLDARNALTHLQVISTEDMNRMAELNVMAVVNDWACKQKGFYEETEVKYLGEERASNEYPYKSFLNAGVHTSFATDFGGSFLVDTIYALHVFATRSQDNDPAHVLNASECFTMDETLKLMTASGAYQLKREDSFGTLAVGMEADLIILSRDVTTVGTDQILGTKVLKTMSDGKWVYDAAAAAN